MSSTTRLLAVALAAVLAAVGLSACGTKKLKDTEVADEVKSKALAPKGVTGARVVCPKETEAKKDTKIRCTVSDSEGNKGSVTATVLDDDGKLGRFDNNTEDLQRAVVESNASEEARSKGVSGDLSCGSATTPKEGAIYICTGNIKGSGPAGVVVTQTDDRGNVKVVVRKRKINTAKIQKQVAAAIEKQQGIDVNVDCPGKVKSKIGAKFTCTVTNPANGRSLQFEAIQTTAGGKFSLKRK